MGAVVAQLGLGCWVGSWACEGVRVRVRVHTYIPAASVGP